VKVSEATRDALRTLAAESDSVIESEADMNPTNVLDAESTRSIESKISPELTLLPLNGAAENGEKPNIV
jgi:hypothetical protein